jgi:hypothetical protein
MKGITPMQGMHTMSAGNFSAYYWLRNRSGLSTPNSNPLLQFAETQTKNSNNEANAKGCIGKISKFNQTRPMSGGDVNSNEIMRSPVKCHHKNSSFGVTTSMGYGGEVIVEAEQRLERMWSDEKTEGGLGDSQAWRGLSDTPTHDSEVISKDKSKLDAVMCNLKG